MSFQITLTDKLRTVAMDYIKANGLDTPQALEKATNLSRGRCRMLLQTQRWESRDACAVLERLGLQLDITVVVRPPATARFLTLTINPANEPLIPARMDDPDHLTIDVSHT